MSKPTAITRVLSLGLLIGPIAVALGALPSGCGPTPEPPQPDAGPACKLAYIGDKTKDIQLELLALDPALKSMPLKDGDALPMIVPPQGGYVVFVGVRANNLDPCGVKLSGVMRDPTTQQVMVDSRTVNLDRAADGWGLTSDGDIASFANVSVCPNQWASMDLYGHTFEVQVTVVDKDKRTATIKAPVKPTCAEPEFVADCMCTCKQGYVLGEMCDGGASTGSTGTGAGGAGGSTGTGTGSGGAGGK
jgi:hypothetical protein